MACVLLTVAQQDLVQLFEVVLVEWHVPPGVEHQVHQLGVASHLLLVARLKSLDCQVRQQLFQLPIRQFAALDSGEEPMLSMVASLRSAVRRSGARVPRARQAPLNSSIRAIKRKISGEMWRVSVRNMESTVRPITPIWQYFTASGWGKNGLKRVFYCVISLWACVQHRVS